MRIFPPELEERAFRFGLLKEWRAARLVSPEAADKIAADLGEPPARAAWPLRLVLFGFTVLCQATMVVLVLKDFHDRFAEAIGALLAAAASIALAEAMIRGMKILRHGAEEALVAGAVVLTAFAAERLIGEGAAGYRFSTAVFSLVLALAAAAAYARYGYRLAAIGVAVGLGLSLSVFDSGERGLRVMLAVLYAALLAAVTLWPGLPRRERERLEIARFFLALSVPLCLNLGLERVFGGGFYGRSGGVGMDAFAYTTLVLIFGIPAAWLEWGIRSRERSLVWAGGLGMLVAFCSIKPYFGWARHSWDPAVLGVELIVLALVLKRWLDAGAGGRRAGFSSEEMGTSEPGGALSLLAGAIAAAPASAGSATETMKGRGGDFGGGGAGGSF